MTVEFRPIGFSPLVFEERVSYTYIMTQFSSPQALKDFIEEFLTLKKAQDVVSINLSGRSSYADFLVIATGTSQRHVGSLAETLREELKKKGIKNIHIEGMPQCDWVLVDAGDVVIHIFRPEVRTVYNLEKMWEE